MVMVAFVTASVARTRPKVVVAVAAEVAEVGAAVAMGRLQFQQHHRASQVGLGLTINRQVLM